MTDETATSTEETATLDDIAKEFSASEPPKAEATQQEKSPAPNYVDPVTDPDGFRKWQEHVTQVAALKGDLEKELNELRQAKASAEHERSEREVNGIVDRVHSKLEDGGLTKKFIKAALALRYSEDEKFKTIIDNRHKNPKAFDKALDVVVQDMRKDYAIKADPQLAENVRAMKEAAGAASGSAVQGDEAKKAANMSEAEFARYWSRIRSG